jgi:O-antigen/teichoic acid export membrane protein
MAGAQALVSIVSLFGAYKLLLRFEGTDALGIWSLVGAYAVAIRLLDVSGSSTIGRFVAVAEQGSAPFGTARYIDTGLIVLVLLYGVLALTIWAPLAWLIDIQLPAEKAHIAGNLLPLTLIGLVANVTAASSADALDGIGRADIRGGLMIVGYLLMLMCAAVLIPAMGLTGLALAQIIQFFVVLASSRMLLVRHVAGLRPIPHTPDIRIVKELASYGMRIQLAGFANFLTDPLAKVLLANFGGLSSVASYELASKIVIQARTLLVSGAMPLIPLFAKMERLEDPNVIRIIGRGNRWLFPLVGAMIMASNLSAPFISLIMLGKMDRDLVIMTALLSAGYGLNTFSLFIYLHAQAVGKLRWNIIGQFSIGLTTIAGTLFLTRVLGHYAVPASFALGLILSSALFFYGNLRRERVGFDKILPNPVIALIPLLSIILSAFSCYIYLHSS